MGNAIIRYVSARRLSLFDIAMLGAIGSAVASLNIGLGITLILAWGAFGALMEAHVKALDTSERDQKKEKANG